MAPGQQESHRFRLDLSAVRASDGPGPGTYRIDTGRSPGRQAPGPYCPSTKFGLPRKTPRALVAATALAQQYNTPRSLAAATRTVPNDGPTTAISIGHKSSRGEKMQYPWIPVNGQSTGNQSAATASSSSSTSSGSAGDNAAGVQQQAGNKPVAVDSDKQPAAAPLPITARAGTKEDYGPNSSSLGGHAFSFGPPGGVAAGKQRRRSNEGNVYISAQHTAIDPGPLMASRIPGASSYSIDGKLDLLSTHQGSGTPRFGGGTRRAGSKMYLSAEHAKSDPSLACSPGPGTATLDLMGSISAAAKCHTPPASPRFGPAPSPRAKQPFISMLHEVSRAGQDSPGPAYDSATAALLGTALGDRRTAHFGTEARAAAQPVRATSGGLGPGAYHSDESHLSTRHSGPSFSLGARTAHAPAPTATPGAGAYDISLADKQRLPSTGAPTIKGRLKHGGIEVHHDTPGPGAYTPMGPAEGMGYEAELDWQSRWLVRYGVVDPSFGARVIYAPEPAATPGAASYDISLAGKRRLPNAGALTVKGRLKHDDIHVGHDTPGPGAYDPLGRAEGMGYKAEVDWQTRWQLRFGVFGSDHGKASEVNHRQGAAAPSRQHQQIVDLPPSADQDSLGGSHDISSSFSINQSATGAKHH